MGKDLALGEQEADLLRYVTDHAPISVRDVAAEWGVPRGLARTTVLTMMERLRKKSFLAREKGSESASLQYTPVQVKSELMRSLVQDFVKNKLGGTVGPFVAYLADSPDLSRAEIAELKRIVDSIGAESPDHRVVG